MAKRHWYNGLGGACKVPRSLLGWWYEIKPRDFIDRHTTEPDRYCSDCAKAARLALAAESAPKPSDVVWPKPRPISEAPKNGNRVLVREKFAVGEHWTIARWSLECQDWIDDNKHLCFPTHFLPLPAEVR